MDRKAMKSLGFVVKDLINIHTLYDYCPICGSQRKEDGTICSTCIGSLNRELGE